jgi:hypothetical protein
MCQKWFFFLFFEKMRQWHLETTRCKARKNNKTHLLTLYTIWFDSGKHSQHIPRRVTPYVFAESTSPNTLEMLQYALFVYH